jgi:hypothetical protein
MNKQPHTEHLNKTTHHIDHLMHVHNQHIQARGQSARRGTSHQARYKAILRRGILTSFNPVNYTAGVLLFEATGTFLQDVPVAYHIDGTSAQKNNLCAVLFFDVQNYTDAVILAVFPNVNQGAPAHPPGRLTFLPTYSITSNDTITSGNTKTYTVTGGSSGVPTGALAILISANFTSTSAGAWLNINAHGGNGLTLGNLYSSGGFVNGGGLIPLSTSGQIDIHANGGDCTVAANLYGYVF